MEFSIETPRLIIRPFTLADTQEYFDITRDYKIEKYVSFAYFDNIYDLEDTIQTCYSICDFEKDFYLIIEEKISQKIVGAFIITQTNYKEIYDVCYLIGKPFRRNGYLKEALEAFIKNMPVPNAILSFIINNRNKPSLNFVKSLKGIIEDKSSYKNHKHFLYRIE